MKGFTMKPDTPMAWAACSEAASMPPETMKMSVFGYWARMVCTTLLPSSTCSRAMQTKCGWCLTSSANPSALVCVCPQTS